MIAPHSPVRRALFLLALATVLTTHSPSYAACPALESSPRVTAPIPGLYESIPTSDLALKHIQSTTDSMPFFFTQSHGTGPDIRGHLYSTDVAIKALPNKKNLSIDRGITEDGRIMVLANAELDIPDSQLRFVDVPGVIPLIAGRGIPLQAYITLMQMKMAGVKYGQLTEVHSFIHNTRTMHELMLRPSIKEWMERNPNQKVPVSLIEEELPETHTIQYISTFLIQSGHRIIDLKVDRFSMQPPQWTFTIYLKLAPI